MASGGWLGCGSSDSQPASGGSASGAPSGAGASSAGASAGFLPSAGAAGGVMAGAPNSGAGSSGTGVGGSSAAGAQPSGGFAGTASGGAGLGGGGAGASAGGGHAAGGPPTNCNLSTPVSFQKDVQGFLAKSCGKTVAGGCHVTDSSKTSLGYDHAYDWITAFAHTGSCGKTAPYAKRFEVVLALLAGPKPASCPNARQMPPPGMGAPLTACQVAALQAWLAEPMVSQMHVPVSDDTQALYPPGPYLMPPFN